MSGRKSYIFLLMVLALFLTSNDPNARMTTIEDEYTEAQRFSAYDH